MATESEKELQFVYLSIGYNIIEAYAAMILGSFVGSIALIGFGLDSIVESASGLILIWRLNLEHNAAKVGKSVKVAAKSVALVYFGMGLFVLFESISKIILNDTVQSSLPGMVLALVSLLIVPFITLIKYFTGKKINSQALMADVQSEMGYALLALVLLVGLSINYFFHWWLADPIVGVITVLFIFKKGLDDWQRADFIRETTV